MPSGRLLVTDCGRIANQGGVRHLLEKELHHRPSLRHRPPNWQASGWHILLSGVVLSCKMSQGGFGASGLLWLRHCALWWHWVHTAATLRSTLWSQGLAEPGTCQSASISFILTLLYYSLQHTDEKVETQGFKPRQSDLAATLGILSLNHLKQMPAVPPSVMTHFLGLAV